MSFQQQPPSRPLQRQPGERPDDVTNIHRRWSFTQLNPSSSKASFAISVVCVSVVIVASNLLHLQAGLASLAASLPAGLAALAGAHYLDFAALRGTPINKLAKVAHVSAFANLLWMLTVLLGAAAVLVFSGPPVSADYVVTGMFLAAGLRIGIFFSVFGAGIGRAAAVSFIQPLVLLFAFVPPSYYGTLAASHAGIGFGAALAGLGIAWALATDRAGRPAVASTFRVLQAFLAAWTENNPSRMEELIESRAHEETVGTKVLRFFSNSGAAGVGDSDASRPADPTLISTNRNRQLVGAIALPDVHPGPFGTVGGSNLPHVLFEHFSRKALVMHSVSDHSLNIPSKREVDRYVGGIGNARIKSAGRTCSLPVQKKTGKATCTGIAFGDSAVVMLSLAPAGMEDVPDNVRTELESRGSSLGFSEVLVIDCHNAMGGRLGEQDLGDLLSSAIECLAELKRQPQHEFAVGFASRERDHGRIQRQEQQRGGVQKEAAPEGLERELGPAGLATLVISIADNAGQEQKEQTLKMKDGRRYAIGWADSNNMDNALRDLIISKSAESGVTMLEVCTSDTHSTSGKRTKEGYFALGTGNRNSHGLIAQAYLEMCREAAGQAAAAPAPSEFELAGAQSRVKVMGNKLFEDYSRALDRSMNMTKVFLGITAATYIAMLLALTR